MANKKIKLPEAWKPGKLPKKIGDCIDAALKARAARTALQSEMDALEAIEKQIKEHIIQTFQKTDIEGARGKHGSASLVEKDSPKVVDKEAFGRWVAEHEAWDMLYGKAVEEACRARWEDKVKIDGVEKFHSVSVKLTEK